MLWKNCDSNMTEASISFAMMFMRVRRDMLSLAGRMVMQIGVFRFLR
jgi:hypothetical protein